MAIGDKLRPTVAEEAEASQASADGNAQAIEAMEKALPSCSRFVALYAGLGTRLIVPQPDTSLAEITDTMARLWQMHGKKCALRNNPNALALHFEE